jgi:hypothetical protein
MSFEETYKGLGKFNYFYASVGCIHAMAWLLLILSCYIVPRTWQDKVERREARGFRGWLRDLAYGGAITRARIRKAMLDINPVYWLVGRDRLKVAGVWIFLVATGLCWLWGKLRYPHGWDDQVTFVVMGLWMHSILKYWVAAEACRRFTLDRRSGALELLVSTPMTVREIFGRATVRASETIRTAGHGGGARRYHLPFFASQRRRLGVAVDCGHHDLLWPT